jgi:plasmid stability protein
MASVTIRNLPDEVKDKLRIRAAQNRRSVEAELRAMIVSELKERWEPEVSASAGASRLTWPSQPSMPWIDDPTIPAEIDLSRDAIYSDTGR